MIPGAYRIVTAVFISLGAGLIIAGCATDKTASISARDTPRPQSKVQNAEKAALPRKPVEKQEEQVVLPHASAKVNSLITHYAKTYQVPERLVRRVVWRESRGNPAARNGPYFGLMQILHATAKTMGYKGTPEGLLDAETNLRYAVKYLAGAYMVADGDENQAVRLYARGYYYDAKRKGLLVETGLRPNHPRR